VKYLLDTHIWIWSVSNPDKLSKKIKDILEDDMNECYISSISVWEFLVLLDKGRIVLTRPVEEWLDIALFKSNIMDIPIDTEIAIASRKISLSHQDPADRFIAATALVNKMRLITSDTRLSAQAEVPIVFNQL